jgi:uncharacterized protein
MRVVPVSDDQYEFVASFLLPYEKWCVSLMNRVISHDTPLFVVETESDGIYGVLSLSTGGQIFQFFPEVYECYKTDLFLALVHFFQARKSYQQVFSVAGEASGAKFLTFVLARVYNCKAIFSQEYFLMEQNTACQTECFIPPDIRVVTCTPSMADDLFELQKAFEKEEVLFPGHEFNPALCRFTLERMLKMQTVCVIEKQGRIITKAGSNASGEHYVQIGGVYTVPEERGHDYARILVSHLINFFSARNKKTVLFVKTTNKAALAMYTKAGYIKFGNYMITYFSV